MAYEHDEEGPGKQNPEQRDYAMHRPLNDNEFRGVPAATEATTYNDREDALAAGKLLWSKIDLLDKKTNRDAADDERRTELRLKLNALRTEWNFSNSDLTS